MWFDIVQLKKSQTSLEMLKSKQGLEKEVASVTDSHFNARIYLLMISVYPAASNVQSSFKLKKHSRTKLDKL